MSKLFYFCLLALCISACAGPGGDKAEVSDAKKTAKASEGAVSYAVDLNQSIVSWVGSKPAGKHNGTINLSSGSLSVENGVVSAGNFVMDMNTVTARDNAMDEEKNGQLTGHLRSDDFFDVANYPTAKFEIVTVDDIASHANEETLKLEGATHFVTGNLTLKETTKAVKFPAIINAGNDGVTAKASFNIDRTEWGMHYKSDKSFGDQIIHSKVQIGFAISAE